MYCSLSVPLDHPSVGGLNQGVQDRSAGPRACSGVHCLGSWCCTTPHCWCLRHWGELGGSYPTFPAVHDVREVFNPAEEEGRPCPWTVPHLWFSRQDYQNVGRFDWSMPHDIGEHVSVCAQTCVYVCVCAQACVCYCVCPNLCQCVCVPKCP